MEVDESGCSMVTENTAIYTVLENAVLFLCKESYPSTPSLEIDAIICMSSGNDKQDHVIKIHRTVYKTKKSKTNETVKLIQSLLSKDMEPKQSEYIYKQKNCSTTPNNPKEHKLKNECRINKLSRKTNNTLSDTEIFKTESVIPSRLSKISHTSAIRNSSGEDRESHRNYNAHGKDKVERSNTSDHTSSHVCDHGIITKSPGKKNIAESTLIHAQSTLQNMDRLSDNQDICEKDFPYSIFDVSEIKTEHIGDYMSSSCSLSVQNFQPEEKSPAKKSYQSETIPLYTTKNDEKKVLNMSPEQVNITQIKREIIDVEDESCSEVADKTCIYDNQEYTSYDNTQQCIRLQQDFSCEKTAGIKNFRTKRNNQCGNDNNLESFRHSDEEVSQLRKRRSTGARYINSFNNIVQGHSTNHDMDVDEYNQGNAIIDTSYLPVCDTSVDQSIIGNLGIYTKSYESNPNRHTKDAVSSPNKRNTRNKDSDASEQTFQDLNPEYIDNQFKQIKSIKTQKLRMNMGSHIQFAPEQKIKKFFCKFCGAGFTMNCTRIRHERTTCSGAAYKCDVCDAKFSRTDSKARHMLTSHGIRSTRHSFSFESAWK